MKKLDYSNYHEIYNDDFYKKRNDNTHVAAEKILNVLKKFFPAIGSVADVGGGVGTFLAAAQNVWGISNENITLYEGEYIDKKYLRVPEDRYVAVNLEERLPKNGLKDLVICLEVAEHLSDKRADSFVEDLTQIGEIIMFSAAYTKQGGDNHINEQPLKYWMDIFSEHGYKGYDIVRPFIQFEKDIPYWYRQNIVVFVKEKSEREKELNTNKEWLPPLDMICYESVRGRLEMLDNIKKNPLIRLLRLLTRR